MTRPRSRGSLTWRLTAIATGATAVVLGLVLLGVFLAFSHQLKGSVDSSLRVRADDLQAAISQSGPTAVRQEGLAEVYDRAGTLLASSRADRSGARLLSPGTDVTCPGPDVLLPATAVLGAGKKSRPLRVLGRCLPDGQVLAVAVSVEQQDEAQDQLLKLIVVIAPLLLVGVAVTLWRAVRGALRPVDELTRQAQEIGAGDETTLRVPSRRHRDEISRLADTLQEMLARLSVSFSREQAFVDDAAHELRTPLAVLRGELELALSDLDDADGVEVSLRAALAEAERLSRLAEDLLELARQRTTHDHDLDHVDLEPLLSRFALRMHAAFPVSVDVVCAPGLALTTDTDRLERVLTNLVANAAAAQARSVVVSAQPSPDGPTVVLVVEDDGPGFDPEFLPTAFERFSRADEARTRATGAGLGLALVQALVTRLGGNVTADNASTLGGAAVRFTLPA